MLENLRITDVTVHEVFQRGADRKMVQPDYAVTPENLSVAAMTAFRLRVTDALSAKAKAMDMDIRKTGPNTFQGDAADLVSLKTADEFLIASRRVVDRLAESQLQQNIPGGIVIVFRGVTGPLDRPFLGVIKAEVQDGFRRQKNGDEIITEFVADLFLTKATRLYKIGFMAREVNDLTDTAVWRAIVFDHQIVANNREAAAIYFYEAFLGCEFREDSAYETAKFFNLTREFSAKNIPDREIRHNVQDSLYTYVKNDQAPTFTVREFAERHVPLDLRDGYEGFMKRKQFPTRAIKRDTAELKNRLKRRKFKYGTDIELSASPEAFAEGRVIIATQPGEQFAGGKEMEVTTVTITAPFIRET